MNKGFCQETCVENNLWIARMRAGYPQKQVATLLGARSLSVISEYEKGKKLPSLRAALKLELIYQLPLAQLYPSLYSELSREVTAAKRCLPVRQRERRAIQHTPCNQPLTHEFSPSRPEPCTSASLSSKGTSSSSSA